MKITGGSSYIKFDMGNGCIVRAEGEMLINKTFLVYKSSMKRWESPHENEALSERQINEIIEKVEESMTKDTGRILFC